MDEPAAHVADSSAHAPSGAGAAHLRAATGTGEAGGVVTGSPQGLVGRAKAAFGWLKQTRPMRANTRFGRAGGGVLTGGIAYAGLFSVFAGLTLGFTIFLAFLGNDEVLKDKVIDTVSGSLPGLIKTSPSSSAPIDPDTLHVSGGFSVAGAVALVVLVLSAISAMGALKTGVRAMFDEPPSSGNAVAAKGRQLLGFAGMAFLVLVSAVLSIVVTSAADWLLHLVHVDDSTGLIVRVLGIAVALVVDMATFLLIVRVLASLHPAWHELWRGALIAGVGIGVVRVLGTSVVAGSATKNPLLASFAVIVVLLVWINLIARIVLLAAAWTADPPLPDDEDDEPAEDPEPADHPDRVEQSVRDTP